jgi:rhamnosyltransferase
MAQVAHMILVDNSDRPLPEEFAQFVESNNVTFIRNGKNLGIATALNRGATAARNAGFKWLLTMDQDSTITQGMVDALADCAESQSERLALVSPVHEQVGGRPRPIEPGCRETRTAMTSGNLVNLDILVRVGGYMDELFIDQVDNEICLRLWRKGYKVLEAGSARLQHRVGNVKAHRFPYPAFTSNHSPLRRYYIMRNRLLVARMYKEDFPGFGRFELTQQLKETLKILLYERQKAEKFKMIYRGWRDYRKGRFGAYEEDGGRA